MAAPSFLQVLKAEVARMQTLHPERLGEPPSPGAHPARPGSLPCVSTIRPPALCSPAMRRPCTVSTACAPARPDSTARAKHLQWKRTQHIAGKVEAPPVPPPEAPTAPLPEAPASVNVRLQVAGRDVQWTLRDADEERLARA